MWAEASFDPKCWDAQLNNSAGQRPSPSVGLAARCFSISRCLQFWGRIWVYLSESDIVTPRFTLLPTRVARLCIPFCWQMYPFLLTDVSLWMLPNHVCLLCWIKDILSLHVISCLFCAGSMHQYLWAHIWLVLMARKGRILRLGVYNCEIWW